MNSFTRVPVTAAVFAGMAILLSGCIAYDAASAVVDAGTTVVGTTVDVAGDIVTSPFDGDNSDKKKSN
jgi:archaellin